MSPMEPLHALTRYALRSPSDALFFRGRKYFSLSLSLWRRDDGLRRCDTAAAESGDGCEPFIVVLWNVAINSNLSKSGRWKSGIGRNLTGLAGGRARDVHQRRTVMDGRAHSLSLSVLSRGDENGERERGSEGQGGRPTDRAPRAPPLHDSPLPPRGR